MSKRKLQRFEELNHLERIFQYPFPLLKTDHGLRGNWRKNIFKNDNPLILELGCGRGEYTVEMAREYADKNFIGIDIKGARIWRGVKSINEENILTAAVLRTHIEWLNQFFADQEVDDIWVTFPDPQPQLTRENRRLTNSRFISLYRQVLKSNGYLHLKTDNIGLFQYTVDQLKNEQGTMEICTYDLYHDTPVGFNLSIQTTYEKIFMKKGFPIHYLKFKME